MAAADTATISQSIHTLSRAAEDAIAQSSPVALESFERQLGEIDALTRELQQQMWADAARRAIQHLEGNQPLTDEDFEVIRVFMVSDAENYLSRENNYDDWLDELRRLMHDLATEAKTLTRETIGDYRGLLRDAMRLVPSIRNYYEEKQRLSRFDATVHTLDARSRRLLVDLLREQIDSPRR